MDPFDLATLFAYRETMDGLDQQGRPTIASLGPVRRCRSVALLPGSFNPPTAAHLMLAERALRDGYDCVMFLLAKRPAGKEPSGLIPEDRLLALRSIADGAASIGVSSHALYAEQAEAAADVFGDAELSFLVGSDKVLQIFDPVWYDDRDAALDRLFARARLVVAPRSDHARALSRCLDDPDNDPWTRNVSTIRLHPAVCDLSSTHVRGMLRAGAEPSGLVPPAVAAFLASVHAFAPPKVIGAENVDAYEMRARLIDALWRLNGRLSRALDLRALMDLALGADEDGDRFRAALHAGATDDVASAVEMIAGR